MSHEGEITLTIHGLDVFNRDVDGEVFAEKFAAFMRGLAAADIATNGKRRHKFLISGLEKNTATARVREQLAKHGPPPTSSVQYYDDGINAIREGRPSARQLPVDFVKQVARLNRGVGKTFAFGELKLDAVRVVRIDDYLKSRAEKLLRDLGAEDEEEEVFFSGAAYGTFDGILKEVDLRGQTKRAVLILTAGGLQVPCVVDQIEVERLRACLDRRAIITGLARYGGAQGLPELIEVSEIAPTGDANLTRWVGAFKIPTPEEDDWENL